MPGAGDNLILKYSAPNLRAPAGARFGRGGQYISRYLAELGNAKSYFEEKNRELAQRVQNDVVEALDEGLIRREVSTGRLHDATADPKNIFASAQTWGVGDAEWLDKSQARYWRTIDQGSLATWKHPFAGMTYYVNRKRAWGASIGGMNANGAVAGPPWSASRAGVRSEKFNPLSDVIAESIIAENGKVPRWMGTVTIHNEIEPQNYYERGFAISGGIIQALRTYRSLTRKTGQG